jgi:hypothetical protein
MKDIITLLLLVVLSSPIAYYELYIWKCSACSCKYYGNNPPKDSKCLKTYMNDIWELERIELVPLTPEQLKELG